MPIAKNDPLRYLIAPTNAPCIKWRCARCGEIHLMLYPHKWVVIKGYKRRVCKDACGRV